LKVLTPVQGPPSYRPVVFCFLFFSNWEGPRLFVPPPPNPNVQSSCILWTNAFCSLYDPPFLPLSPFFLNSPIRLLFLVFFHRAPPVGISLSSAVAFALSEPDTYLAMGRHLCPLPLRYWAQRCFPFFLVFSPQTVLPQACSLVTCGSGFPLWLFSFFQLFSLLNPTKALFFPLFRLPCRITNFLFPPFEDPWPGSVFYSSLFFLPPSPPTRCLSFSFSPVVILFFTCFPTWLVVPGGKGPRFLYPIFFYPLLGKTAPFFSPYFYGTPLVLLPLFPRVHCGRRTFFFFVSFLRTGGWGHSDHRFRSPVSIFML